jgi:coenzyme F420-reducing hydrogenase beta subunit
VTVLLSALLQSKIVDKAVALCEGEKGPIPRFRSLVCVAPSLLKTSFYVDPESDFVTEVLDGHRAAFVGLPCQIRGVKQMCEERGIPHPILIGLFCGGISRITALEVFLRRIGVKLRDVKHLSFRGSGLYGHFTLSTDRLSIRFDRVTGRRTREKQFHDTIFFGPFFQRKCLTCTDVTGEEADVSFGDAWISRITDRNAAGTNICIIRTERGRSLIDHAVERGIMGCGEVKYEEVISSQGSALIGRKLGLWNYPTLAVSPRNVIFESEVRYFSPEHSPPFSEICRRQVLWNLARLRYLQLFIPEFDAILRSIMRQLSRVLVVIRAVKRKVARRS